MILHTVKNATRYWHVPSDEHLACSDLQMPTKLSFHTQTGLLLRIRKSTAVPIGFQSSEFREKRPVTFKNRSFHTLISKRIPIVRALMVFFISYQKLYSVASWTTLRLWYVSWRWHLLQWVQNPVEMCGFAWTPSLFHTTFFRIHITAHAIVSAGHAPAAYVHSPIVSSSVSYDFIKLKGTSGLHHAPGRPFTIPLKRR